VLVGVGLESLTAESAADVGVPLVIEQCEREADVEVIGAGMEIITIGSAPCR
jgi:hypothetical protein